MAESYSVIGILLEASIVVQLVMLALVVISVLSWAVIFGRSNIQNEILALMPKQQQTFFKFKY